MEKRAYIKWEHEKVTASEVGNKSYKLGELKKIGIKIPQGFTLTTNALLDFIDCNDICDELGKLVADISLLTSEVAQGRNHKLQNLFDRTSIPDKISNEIAAAYDKLTSSFREEDCLAVRSSSIIEDLKSASFAGLYNSFLQLKSLDEILEAVKKCWQSAFDFCVLAYLKKLNLHILNPKDTAIAVIVQKMINQRFAGVMFTVDPVNGDSSKILIEYSDKPGEFIVSGKCTPNSLLVDKITGQIERNEISEKNKSLLEEKYIFRLVDLAKKIEKHFGSYQDIEWVIDRDSFFPEDIIILQTRPETVWNQKCLKSSRKSVENVLHFIPRVEF